MQGEPHTAESLVWIIRTVFRTMFSWPGQMEATDALGAAGKLRTCWALKFEMLTCSCTQIEARVASIINYISRLFGYSAVTQQSKHRHWTCCGTSALSGSNIRCRDQLESPHPIEMPKTNTTLLNRRTRSNKQQVASGSLCHRPKGSGISGCKIRTLDI